MQPIKSIATCKKFEHKQNQGHQHKIRTLLCLALCSKHILWNKLAAVKKLMFFMPNTCS